MSKPVPHDLDAEKAVLGAILLDAKTLAQVAADALVPADFFRDAHQKIYRHLLELDEANEAIDFVTLKAALLSTGELTDVGGPAYLSALVDGVPKASNIRHYAQIVKEHAKRRTAIQIATRLQTAAYTALEPAGALALEATDELLSLAETNGQGPKPLSDLVQERFQTLDYAHQHRGSLTGLSTSFTDLDTLTMGLQPGDLTIVGGRPSQGKSSFAMTIAAHVAKTLPVVFFSLEMSASGLTDRLIAAEAQIDGHRMRGGYLSDKDWGPLSLALGSLGLRKLWIDPSAGLSVWAIRARSLALKATDGLSLIVVDYLQLVQGRHAENRTQEVGSVARGLKRLAKDVGVPVLACAQLSRAVEQRSDKRPQLSDLRECGEIEQEADVVLLLWRPGLVSRKPEDEGIGELILAKQRQGPLGTIRLVFLAEQTRFANLAVSSPPPAVREWVP